MPYRSMLFLMLWLLGTLGLARAEEQASVEPAPSGVSSRVERTASGELVLIQELVVQASLENAWKAYTTEEGWRAWVAPVVELDFQTGGVIRTHYDKEASLGEAGTNTLRIINFVPQVFLTMQSDVSSNWPDFMKQDWKNLYSIVHFEALNPQTTRMTVYGTGYRDNERYKKLLEFFLPANEWTLGNLKNWLEKGIPSDFQWQH